MKVVTYACFAAGPNIDAVRRHFMSFTEGHETPLPPPLLRLAQVQMPLGNFLGWQIDHSELVQQLRGRTLPLRVTLAHEPSVVELCGRRHWGFAVECPELQVLAREVQAELIDQKVSTSPPMLTVLQCEHIASQNADVLALRTACLHLLAGATVEVRYPFELFVHRLGGCNGAYVRSELYSLPPGCTPVREIRDGFPEGLTPPTLASIMARITTGTGTITKA